MVLDPQNTCCEFFERFQKHSWKSVCQESSTLEISIREKHRILMRSVLSVIKHRVLREEEVYRYKVTAHDVLSTINDFNEFLKSRGLWILKSKLTANSKNTNFLVSSPAIQWRGILDSKEDR